jgi:hypothetical protein
VQRQSAGRPGETEYQRAILDGELGGVGDRTLTEVELTVAAIARSATTKIRFMLALKTTAIEEEEEIVRWDSNCLHSDFVAECNTESSIDRKEVLECCAPAGTETLRKNLVGKFFQ